MVLAGATGRRTEPLQGYSLPKISFARNMHKSQRKPTNINAGVSIIIAGISSIIAGAQCHEPGDGNRRGIMPELGPRVKALESY